MDESVPTRPRVINANLYVDRCRELGIDPDPTVVARMDQLAAQTSDVCAALQAYIARLTP